MSFVRAAFRHLPGVGPERERGLRESGVRDWRDLRPGGSLPGLPGSRFDTAIQEGERAWAAGDIGALARMLHPEDHWRLLADYWERVAFFDIETTGLEADSDLALAVCLWEGRLRYFVRGENLDDFLDLLQRVPLLASYNGISFDAPRTARHFNIPSLPCPHVDLRPVARRIGLSGGLKSIELELGFRRPPDVTGLTGEDAVWMWRAWERNRDRRARNRLLRYCATDVVATAHVAAEMLKKKGATVAADTAAWNLQLPGLDDAPPVPASVPVVGDGSGRTAPDASADTALSDRLARWRRNMRERSAGASGESVR